jgi:hypothetical protein
MRFERSEGGVAWTQNLEANMKGITLPLLHIFSPRFSYATFADSLLAVPNSRRALQRSWRDYLSHRVSSGFHFTTADIKNVNYTSDTRPVGEASRPDVTTRFARCSTVPARLG